MIIEGAEMSQSQKSALQRSTVIHFEFLIGKHWNDIVVPTIFKSAYSKNPMCKVSCFLLEVHIATKICYISAALYIKNYTIKIA